MAARERQILELLVGEQAEWTVKEIADHLQVSMRTVHRDLKHIEAFVETYRLQLHKKSGVGIQLVGDKRELEAMLFRTTHTELTADERQRYIVSTLLEAKGPVKLVGIAQDLRVTIATASNDLTKLEADIAPFGLQILRRRGYGIELAGSEGAKRRLIRKVIADELNETELFHIMKADEEISERLMGLVDRDKMLIIEREVQRVREQLPYKIVESSYVGLVVHLALAVERIQQGERVTLAAEYLAEQKATKEYVIAAQLVRQLERTFALTIPEAEIGYITMHLRGAKLRYETEAVVEDETLQLAMQTKRLVQVVGEKVGRDLTRNASLFEGLMLHLRTALFRIEQQMGISNPLLPKIQQDYTTLFHIVDEAMATVFPQYNVPAEEIGYLVMHFGAVILYEPAPRNMTVLVICSSGIGTSKMLATRLQKEFPHVQGFRNVSLFELHRIAPTEYDFVVSTIPLPDFSGPYILVSPILTPKETETIRHVMQQGTVIEAKAPLVKSLRQVERQFVLIKEYAEQMANLLASFRVSHLPLRDTLEAYIELMCHDEAVANALLQREERGGLGIPSTTLTLFHTRHPHIERPSFQLFTLEEPVVVMGMDNELMEASLLLLLVAPELSSTPMAELLSYISALLIESEETTALFETGNEKQISTFLAMRLEHYFDEKVKEIRSGV